MFSEQHPLRCFLCLALVAVVHIDVLSQHRLDSIHSVYDSIQLKFFPTGILHNRSPYYLQSQDTSYQPNPYNFTGSPNSPICLSQDFMRLHKDLYLGAIDSTRIWPPSSRRFYDSLIGFRYEMPLKVMHMEFHRLKENAVDSGYILFDSVNNYYPPIRDTTWVDRNQNHFIYRKNADSLGYLAFEKHTLFALSCIKPTIVFEQPDFEVEFMIHAISVIENISQVPDNIEIDYGDGLGLRKTFVGPPIQETVNFRVPVSCLQKEYKKKIRIRFHYLDRVFESSTYVFLEPSEQLMEQSHQQAAFLSPNPAHGHSTVNFECPIQNARIRVFSSDGKIIFQDQIQGDTLEFPLDLTIAKGIYFIEINGQHFDRAILKWVII